MNEKPVIAEPSLDDLRQRLKAREAAPDVEPITRDELRQAHAWRKRWHAVKYPLMALTRLLKNMAPWILGLGVGMSALVDAWYKWTGGGGTPK